jgi:hypothetical protein
MSDFCFVLFFDFKVTNLLVEMDHSVRVLKDIPEFQESAQKLAFYKEKLESFVRPKLIQSFNQHNTGHWFSFS